MADGRLPAHATNTHLYRGARLLTSIPASELAAGPRELTIVFHDGVEIPAELLQNEHGDLALEVPSYRTGAGTRVAMTLWHATIDDLPDGSAIVLGTKV
ncbi:MULTISPECIES: hypothetical protein [Microbacterium]|uniref:hypothetical protein n=1 Tax=Microbacterium TaxID=33882 RepID=UPI00217D4F4B|nr:MULTISPECIES: hypothetical protein [Microbacterium]UWF77414.1 hypothetical protein JSY13_11725 [Microbacterium neungamense]WCM55576.1 hypothetical protein JRG78_11735 [Microbacterium sp. EF45047]